MFSARHGQIERKKAAGSPAFPESAESNDRSRADNESHILFGLSLMAPAVTS